MSESAKPKDEGRSIPVGIGTAILLFGFILQFFSVRQSLPIEIQIVSAIFVGATAFLFVVWVWYPSFGRYFTERRSAGREDRLARENMETLNSYIDKLRALGTTERNDNVVYPIRVLKGSGGEWNKLPELYFVTYYIDALTFQLRTLMSQIGVNRFTFTYAVDTVTFLVRMFNENLFRIVTDARLIAEKSPVPQTVREDYNTFRHSYIRFLDDYTSFVNELNKRFRSEVVNMPGDVGTVTQNAFRPMYADRPKEL